MTAALRDRQKDRLCNALAAVGPGAPTLCADWEAHDLAVHLWMLKHDPTSWPADVVPALRGWARKRAKGWRERWPYAELVERLRAEPGHIACMPGDSIEGHRHALGEYVVHTVDVTRANGLPEEPPDEELEDALWKRVKVAGPMLRWFSDPGLVLRRSNGATARIGRPTRRAATIVTGEPGELMCWVYGREAVADVVVETTRPRETAPRGRTRGHERQSGRAPSRHT